jgi:glutamine synthetase adenylyltransferase
MPVVLEASLDPRAEQYWLDFQVRHPEYSAQFDQHPERALWLSTIFACSRFLAEELLRHPEWLESVRDLDAVLSKDDFSERLARFESADLALFRRHELVRIVLRDRLELASLSEITGQTGRARIELQLRRRPAVCL